MPDHEIRIKKLEELVINLSNRLLDCEEELHAEKANYMWLKEQRRGWIERQIDEARNGAIKGDGYTLLYEGG